YNGAANGGDESYTIGIDFSGNIFISGNSDQGATSADIVTIKYTPSGNEIVSVINLPNFQRPNALKINNNGDVFIAGITRTGANPSFDDYITIKYNNSLTFQWSKTYNGTANNTDNALALVTDASGNVYVTGFSYWTGQFYNYVTIKYNSNGDSLNAASYNGPLNNNDVPTSIGIDNANNIYVTGYSVAATSPAYVNDYATLQYNSSLVQQWVNRYNDTGNGDDKATSLAIDRFNNVYVTGFSANSLLFYDYLSIKYNSSGTPLCTLRQNVAGSNLNAYATQIVVDTAQVFYLTGAANVSGSGLNYLTIRNSLYPVGLKSLSGEVPAKYNLYQNYPNPFNPFTIIRFDVSAASIVKLAVFDVSGKEISILANEYLKPGVYEYSWDASDYSSGIYFYRLSTEKYSETKKMALIK
ncbi:MAG: T9SS C-terminal target domain-containing protein, partial [Geobacter sp.]